MHRLCACPEFSDHMAEAHTLYIEAPKKVLSSIARDVTFN